MSDNWFLNDEYDGEADAPRGLRDAYRALKSEFKKMETSLSKAQADLADAQKATKQATFEQLLADKNVPAKVARWMKRDEVDPTSEAIDKWLAENGEDFGWKPQQTQNGEAPADTPDGVSVEEADEIERANALSGDSSGAGGTAAKEAQIRDLANQGLSLEALISKYKEIGLS